MIHTQDADFTLLNCDVLDGLRTLPDESVHCVVTSPPYFALRDYGVTGQLGLEGSVDEYVASIVGVFSELRRVLRNDGTLWLNLGDAFESKQLIGSPWRVAFALQADGWYLRSDIIWSKPNPMPESVTDRPTKAHEFVFLLSKGPRYFFDQEAVRSKDDTGKVAWAAPSIAKRQEAGVDSRNGNPSGGRNIRSVWEIATQPYPEAHFATYPEELVRRCVLAGTSEQGCCPECGAPWEREVEKTGGTTGKSWHDHSDDLGRGQQKNESGMDTYRVTTLGWRPRCDCEIKTSDADGCDEAYPLVPIPCTVLDPFLGSGTTAYVARKHGRRSIGIELNPDYCELAARRMQQQSLFALEAS